MIFEMLSKGRGGVKKGVVGTIALATAFSTYLAVSPNTKPKTLTPKWRDAEKGYRVFQNISER